MRAPPASEQPRDGGFPCGEFAFAHGGIHVRREAALQLPMLREAIGLEKKPGVRAGEITRGDDANFLLPRTRASLLRRYDDGVGLAGAFERFCNETASLHLLAEGL